MNISGLSLSERLELIKRLQASLAPADVPRAAARQTPEPAEEEQAFLAGDSGARGRVG